jgi:integrase
MKKNTRGMGRTFRRGRIYWISFYHRGEEIRESSESESDSEARKLLKRRLAESQTGRFIFDEEKVTFEHLADGLITDYKLNNRRSLETAANNANHLRAFFGLDRAIDISIDRFTKYQLRRIEQGASVATINRETSTLRRMFSLAMKAGKVSRRPAFDMLHGERIRQGFVEHGDFLRLIGELPEHIRPLVEFLYYAGWRKSAARNLEWKEIDMNGRTARLKADDSKNAEAWVLPFAGRVWEVIQERAKARRLDCRFVFHRDGKKIGDFRKAWQSACVAAGLGSFVKEPEVAQADTKKKRQRKRYAGLIIHDLRRCAARNLSRAGVSEVVAMKITGHKTASMYRRYRIIDENELRDAQQKMQQHLQAQPPMSKVATTGGAEA